MKVARSPQRSVLYGNMIRIGGLLSVALFILILSAGCRYTAAPADLLQKPKIAADKQVLLQAIEKELPDYSKLTLPLREKNMEAIRILDVDGDGVKEAVVTFYNEYSTPELLVLKQTDGKWKSWVGVEQPMARQIAWLDIIDLDRDGKLELLVGWTGAFESPNVLEIYSFHGKTERNERGNLVLKPLDSLPYSYAETGDMNGDGLPELAIISETHTNREKELPAFQLTIYNWNNNALHAIVEQSLFNEVNTYERLLIGQVSPRLNGVVLEASTGAHGTFTAMYVWEKRGLRLVYPAPDDPAYGISGKPTKSGDVNGDGIIELALVREAPDELGVPYVDAVWINDWVQWDGQSSFAPVMEEFTDSNYGLTMRIPEQWSGKYTLRKSQSDPYSIVTIDVIDSSGNGKAELATLYAVPKKDWDALETIWKDEQKSYHHLFADSGNVFAVSFVKEAPQEWNDADKNEFNEMLKIEDQMASYLTIRND
ncbi:FG-GAP repeat domain-containing protein [Paenibacillus sp. YIM B09110]|uniref:FG-GAP repeat domain-containing protein n=1 Tax=Paenibacillus sp. YIM B09110 TaxID=3126102 RepID=UPI00301BE489